MTAATKNVEQAFCPGEGALRRAGRRRRQGPRPPGPDSDLAALLAGGRRRRVRERRRGARRRPGRHGQLPRQGADRRRAARRPRQGALADPRHAPAEPPRQLRRDRRQGRRPRRAGAFALPGLDRLGEVEPDGDGLQPHLLLASQGGRRLDPRPPRQGDPPVLDRPRHRLPEDRRGLRRGARLALRDQRLDSRRLQGPARSTAKGPASGSPSRSTRCSPSRSTPS